MRFYPAADYAIGAISYHEGLSVSKEHGVYQVRGFRKPDAKHVNRGFRTLKEVKAFIKDPSQRY